MATTTARDEPTPQVAANAAAAPLTGGTLVLGTIVLSLATFMNVLDTSIANVSIPAIAGDLGVSRAQATWVITSFAVANAISLPLTGWLTQRYGQVRLFTASVLLFVLASLLCAVAPSIELLILFRVIQGAVAGPMIPLSQTLLLASYPKEKAGTALGMWAITTLVVAVDLLHQPSDRARGRRRDVGHLPQARIGDAQAADRCGGAGPPCRLGG